MPKRSIQNDPAQSDSPIIRRRYEAIRAVANAPLAERIRIAQDAGILDENGDLRDAYLHPSERKRRRKE